MTITPGITIGPYEVQEHIGSGGMGDVFKARDTRLHRTVALKVLRSDGPPDDKRRRRFLQEARLVSALNHPHIVVLHDILSENNSDILVMEYLAGKTLDRVIPDGGLRLNEVLRYGIQIADALAAAHQAGIVHRDLKPANIGLTETGSVKLLDLGLAKLFEPDSLALNAATGTLYQTAAYTEEGTVAGTASYMSPEQAEGRRVDARSDVFSFGCVLYEMVSGRRAFGAQSPISTLTAILRDEPRPLAEFVDGVPYDLEKIIARCLRKDPERRWQSMQDVRNALEEVKEDTDSGKLVIAQIRPRAAARRGRRAVMLLAGAAVVMITVTVMWVTREASRVDEEPVQAVPLTTYPGAESSPSLSPDGNEVAFAWQKPEEKRSQIYLKLIGPGDPLRLTDGPFDTAPAWSPDGRWIAFRRSRAADHLGAASAEELRIVGALGGGERKLADLNGPATLSWSADSKSILCGEQKNRHGLAALVLVSADSGETHDLLVDRAPGETLLAPALSPNSRRLAYVRRYGSAVNELMLIPLGPDLKVTGEPMQLARSGEANILPVWTSDGSQIIFQDGTGNDAGLWRMSATGRGVRHRVDVGTEALQPSVSLHGDKLAYARSATDLNIWRAPAAGFEGNGEPANFISSSRDEREPQYSPDGKRIAFSSHRSGSAEIWTADSDGSHLLQITFLDKHSGTPRWSPDSRRLVFDSNATPPFYQAYTIDATHGRPKRLTGGQFENAIASWSRDGQWIYFESPRTGRTEIWKIPAEGGTPRQVTTTGGYTAFESEDGQWLFFTAANAAFTSLMRMPAAGGVATEILKAVHPRNFAVSSRGIHYMTGDPARATEPNEVAFYDFATKKSRTVLPLKRTVNLGLAVSPDGKWLLYSQLDQNDMHLMLVDHFR